MKGMVIRMNAKKNGKHTEKKPRRTWGIALRTGLLGIMAASLMLFGVACTGDGAEDGTVADSNVGSVTSTPTERETGKDSERVTERQTEARTEMRTEAGTVASTVPGTTVPGTTPGTGITTSPETEGRETTGMTTTPGTTTPGTNTDTTPNRNRSGIVRGKG